MSAKTKTGYNEMLKARSVKPGESMDAYYKRIDGMDAAESERRSKKLGLHGLTGEARLARLKELGY